MINILPVEMELILITTMEVEILINYKIIKIEDQRNIKSIIANVETQVINHLHRTKKLKIYSHKRNKNCNRSINLESKLLKTL